MNLLEAVTFLRENILDDVGGLNSDWSYFSDEDSDSLQLRWTNEEITRNIDEAVTQAYRRILPVKELNVEFDITTEIGTIGYTLDPRILQVLGVRSTSTGKTLKRIDIQEVWDNKKLLVDTDIPTCYIPNYTTGTISLYKAPSNIDTYSLLTYRLPLKKLDWKNNLANIELREEFIIPMLSYAASICYDKDEANTLDPGRAVYFLQRFNQEFPATSAYSDTRKRSTSNRAVGYGGL